MKRRIQFLIVGITFLLTCGIGITTLMQKPESADAYENELLSMVSISSYNVEDSVIRRIDLSKALKSINKSKIELSSFINKIYKLLGYDNDSINYLPENSKNDILNFDEHYVEEHNIEVSYQIDALTSSDTDEDSIYTPPNSSIPFKTVVSVDRKNRTVKQSLNIDGGDWINAYSCPAITSGGTSQSWEYRGDTVIGIMSSAKYSDANYDPEKSFGWYSYDHREYYNKFFSNKDDYDRTTYVQNKVDIANILNAHCVGYIFPTRSLTSYSQNQTFGFSKSDEYRHFKFYMQYYSIFNSNTLISVRPFLTVSTKDFTPNYCFGFSLENIEGCYIPIMQGHFSLTFSKGMNTLYGSMLQIAVNL